MNEHASIRTRRARWLWVLALVGLSTAGCPQQSAEPASAERPCKEVGQNCEVAPGKLGTCVLRDDCREPSCFVCQSQH